MVEGFSRWDDGTLAGAGLAEGFPGRLAKPRSGGRPAPKGWPQDAATGAQRRDAL